MRLLFLYESSQTYVNTVFEHLQCFRMFSSAETCFAHADQIRACPVDLAIFDCVVIHYSVRVAYNLLSESFANALTAYSGLKVLFIQDEYDYTERARRWIERLRINVVFTCVPHRHRELIYPSKRFAGVTFVSNLSGYVPLAFDQLPEPVAIKKRRIVIGYRGRPLPYWYGTLGQEKVWIGQKMKAICEARRIPVDIAWEEHQRIYGRKWYEFLGSCRATLGTESGSNVFDDDGSIRESILTEIKNDPGFSYEQVNEKYLREYERPGLMNQISPKVFEAIAMRTALVLFEGKYSEVLEPERHFIPLRKDFSNIDSVLNTLADLPYLEELTQRAYREVVESGRYTYRRFAEMVDNVLQQHAVHIAPNRLRQNNDVLDSALSRVLDQGAITMSPVRCYIESAAAKPRSLPEAITHRIQSIIGIRREPRGDNVPLKISRRMLETQLNFYREHGIECAFDHRPDTYVAANKGQAMPQSFSVNLRRRRSIDRVVVQWVSPGNLAEAYCLRLRVGDRVTWQKSADGNELQLNAFEMCGAEADCIELSVNRFRGQQRLLLRNVQIFPKQS